MFGFHGWELLILVGLGLIIFGPKRLPEMGSAIGKTIREFQKSMREVTNPEPPSSIPPGAAQSPQASVAAPAVASEPATQATATATAVAENSAPSLAEEDAGH